MTKDKKKAPNTKQKKPTTNIRIIAGQWRGRKVPVLDSPGLRPTTDRIRETVFNWLAPYLPGSTCLDLFAGSGALSFEALSREASHANLIEIDKKTSIHLKTQLNILKSKSGKVSNIDAIEWLSQPPATKYDMVFIDPPFDLDLIQQCCDLLDSQQILKNRARIYIESGSPLSELTLPETWHWHREQKAGMVYYGLAIRDISYDPANESPESKTSDEENSEAKDD